MREKQTGPRTGNGGTGPHTADGKTVLRTENSGTGNITVGNCVSPSPDEMTTKEKRLLTLAFLFTLAGVVLQVLRGTKFLGQLSLCAALLCAGWIYLDRWAARDRRGVKVKRFILAALAAGIALFAALEALIIKDSMVSRAVLPADAVIVLGAGLQGDVPTPALQLRLETAADYLAQFPDIPVVVSGGQGRDEDIPEAAAMETALIALGVDPSRILTEDRATSTKENLVYSRPILEAAGVDPSTAEIAVVTNGFHILRTRMLAARQGLHIVGIPAPEPYSYLTVNDTIREAFALAKSFLVDW